MPCHNGNGPKGSSGSEYGVWMQDKHAKSYQVLRTPRSEAIQLARSVTTPAHQDGLCLSCHVGPSWEEDRANARNLLSDGVSCESCHGPAEKWLTAHYRPPWRTLSTAEKERLGMKNVATLTGRIQTCVGCHVGAGRSAVNHDLIAAGHPPLKFELAAYHAVMPHHWDDRKDTDRAQGGRRDFEAQAWSVGQVGSARAALELLAFRAREDQSAGERPWPELAEYDCFACHHDLQAKSWRQTVKPGRRPGTLPWGTWYFAVTERATSSLPLPEGKELRAVLQELRASMAKGSPKREMIREKAARGLDILQRQWSKLERELSKPAPVPALFRNILEKDQAQAVSGWDGAAQTYLALAALHQAWIESEARRPPAAVKQALQSLRRDLFFPGGFDSPRRFDPAAIQRTLRRIQDASQDR
jgi:hypothetical protein